MKRKQIVNWGGATNSLLVIVFVFVLFISVGYSTLSTTLNISGEAYIRVPADIRITNVNWIESESEGYETYNSEYYKDGIKVFTTLPNIDSTVTYEIEGTNSSNAPYELKEINNIIESNENIEYIIENNINIGSIIEGNSKVVINVKVKYKENVLIVPEKDISTNEIEFVFDLADKIPPILISVINNYLKTYILV